MRKSKKFFNLLFILIFLLSSFSFTSAQQPEWYLHYSTGNLFDFFYDLNFINENYGWVGGTDLINAKLLMTTDGGSSWVEIQESLFSGDLIHSIFFIDTLRGWLGMEYNRILKTVDGAHNWIEQPLGLPDAAVRDIYFRNQLEGWVVGGGVTPGYPTIEKGFINHTTDGVQTWQLVNDDTLIYKKSICFSDSLHGIIIGWHQHVYTTEDGGVTWDLNTNFGPNYSFVDCIVMDDSSFAILGSVLDSNGFNLYPLFGKSSDWGQNWNFTIWQNSEVKSFSCANFIDSQIGWFGAQNGKFVYTSDGGQTFQIFETFTDYSINAIQMLNENNGWACGTGWGPIFKYGIPTGITTSPGITAIPEDFTLEQNYPNPFNPVTMISYSIPKKGYVNLTVFDALGNKVKSLVNMIQKTGNHRILFDASHLSSGIYYYRLQFNQQSLTKKMLLIH